MDQKEQDAKIQEILNQQGAQGRVNSAIVIAGTKANDETTKEIEQDAEATKRAAQILKELDGNAKVQKNIREISEEIERQLYKQNHSTGNSVQPFSTGSIHQASVDKYVREANQYIYDKNTGRYVKKEIINISEQVAKKIAERTMENIAQKSKNQVKDDNQR